MPQKVNTKFSLSVESYAERAQQATLIQDNIAKAERGEKVDLNQTATKLHTLVEELKKDSIAIGKAPLTRTLQLAHQAHKKDLHGLTARINALSSKANSVPLWATPIFYKALIAGGIAAGTLALVQYGYIFSGSSGGTQLQPQPEENPPQLDLNSIVKDVSEKTYLPQGGINNTETDLLVKDLGDRCINLIPGTVDKLNLPSGKAYVGHKIQINHSSAVNATRDPLVHNKILAEGGATIPDGAIISNQIIDASQNLPQHLGLGGMHNLDTGVFNYGVDAYVAHPWISVGSALAFASTAFASMGLAITSSILLRRESISVALALGIGAATGTVAGLGVFGTGTLVNAAVSSYQSNDGYIGSSVNKVGLCFVFNDTVDAFVDTYVVYPWISIGTPLAFTLTAAYTERVLHHGITAQVAGITAGIIAGLGVLGTGTLVNAAVSSYQSNDGYIGSFVNEVSNAGIDFLKDGSGTLLFHEI
jgi:hypothetical protein